MKKYLLMVLLLSGKFIAHAQMPHDGIFMPKKTACLALSYTNSNWSNYWEGNLRRGNQNIGHHITESFAAMAVVGLSNRLNLIVALPYVRTKTTSGNLLGQRGFQDAAIWLKYRFFQVFEERLSISGAVGGTIPASNYIPEYLPMSIGIQSKTLNTRIIVNYLTNSGFYLGGHGTYSYRTNIEVDRDAYLANGKLYYSNEVTIPNTFDAGIRTGYLKNNGRIQAEGFVETFRCISGDNIRRNDMPFPTNKMAATVVGIYAKYQPKKLGINARITQVISGQNVGQSQSYTIGLMYQPNF